MHRKHTFQFFYKVAQQDGTSKGAIGKGRRGLHRECCRSQATGARDRQVLDTGGVACAVGGRGCQTVHRGFHGEKNVHNTVRNS